MSKITDNLYIAGFEETYKDTHLKTKVTHFLNVASEIMISSRANHEYKKIGISDDDPNSDIRDILPKCIEHIDYVINELHGSICVHCLEGKSRSVCVCLAYLCCVEKWNLDDAVELIKKRRPCIDIFPLYLTQVYTYCSQYHHAILR